MTVHGHTSIQPQGGIHHAPSHDVDVSGTRELLITSCAIPWQWGGGRHICMLLYVSCQCSGDTESGHGKKSGLSDEAGNAGGGLMTLARGQLSRDGKDAAVTTVAILGGGCSYTDRGAVSTHTHLIQQQAQQQD